MNYDIGSIPVEGNRVWKPLLQEEYAELLPQISPDGQWMAYVSNKTGQDEIYVRSYPDVNKVQLTVSTSGGTEPRWSPDGRELFYRNGNAVMVALLKTEPVFSFETPKILFQGAFASYTLAEGGLSYFMWDIHPDGKRFLMMKEAATEAPRRINIVLNWFKELKERVPTD
jgi:dipeptidyl aminopeptidase/acylaminoacyl peptidase